MSLAVPMRSMLGVRIRPLVGILAALLELPFEIVLSILAILVAALFDEEAR